VRQNTRVGGGGQDGAPLHGPLWVDANHQAFGGMGGYEIAHLRCPAGHRKGKHVQNARNGVEKSNQIPVSGGLEGDQNCDLRVFARSLHKIWVVLGTVGIGIREQGLVKL